MKVYTKIIIVFLATGVIMSTNALTADHCTPGCCIARVIRPWPGLGKVEDIFEKRAWAVCEKEGIRFG